MTTCPPRLVHAVIECPPNDRPRPKLPVFDLMTKNHIVSFLIARFEKKMANYSQLIISLSLLLKEGIFNTVPTMIGTTKDEGLLSSAQYHAYPDLYHSTYYMTVSP